MRALQGVGVLVTRPAEQAAPLCRLLEEAGAHVVRLPAIEVRAAAEAGDVARRLGPIDAYDLIIFTSANAARFGAALLDGQHTPTVAAIGPATARALARPGLRILTPVGGFDSESLLLHPLLTQPSGRRVLIIKGKQGREHLQDELSRRGAQVVLAEVYERERAGHDGAALAELEAQFADGRIHVVTATSAQIAHSLIETATPVLRDAFDRVHWLVPGARVAAAVRACGIGGAILQAASAADHDLLAAVVRWRSSESGA
jgi:uroporphyrinogen-III synthase